jgi:hypothetical protein
MVLEPESPKFLIELPRAQRAAVPLLTRRHLNADEHALSPALSTCCSLNRMIHHDGGAARSAARTRAVSRRSWLLTE